MSVCPARCLFNVTISCHLKIISKTTFFNTWLCSAKYWPTFWSIRLGVWWNLDTCSPPRNTVAWPQWPSLAGTSHKNSQVECRRVHDEHASSNGAYWTRCSEAIVLFHVGDAFSWGEFHSNGPALALQHQSLQHLLSTLPSHLHWKAAIDRKVSALNLTPSVLTLTD